ncbi:MAG: sulfotransferase domain-containing protein [Proteobacteria bacterium]|nr:sulfotransferase domain-containing protein [Pseudomonadota bacterium]
MDNMVSAYCKPLEIPTFSLFNSAFDEGIPTNEIQEDAGVCFSSEGMFYLGFRHYPAFDLNLAGARSVLLVRDPRDMLVSMYYSVVKSHVIPEKNKNFLRSRHAAEQMSVDEFVLNKSALYVNNFKKYRRKLPAETLTTYRYEDVIYEKEVWLRQIVADLELPLDRKLISRTVKQFDIIPEHEDQDQHIRQVHPGNYQVKLQPETIEILNDKLSAFLSYYNYL